MSREKKILNQISLQQKMVSKAGVNLVNCGRCGSVMLHETNQDKIQCPFCSFKSDPCDFPDYFYEGLELSGEFKED
jgi:uncharacterized CHY-type Zn-finger protein